MRRYFWSKGFPWFRRDPSKNEFSPLLPKSGAAGGDDKEVDLETGTHQTETNNGQDLKSPTWIQTHYSYSWMDYFLKYFLFLCNLAFTVFGLMVLGLGMWGLISKESFAQERIGSIGTDPMLVLVSLGFLLAVLCLTGCVGAIRENSCLLRLFSGILLILITVQVLIAIMAYSMQDQIEVYMRSGMLAAMAGYQDDLDLRFITDEIQTNLQCCGADTYRDWETNMSSGVWRPCNLLRGPAGQRHRVELPVWAWSPAVRRVHRSEHNFSGRLHRGDLPLDRAEPGPGWSCCSCGAGGPDSGRVYYHTTAGKHQLAQNARMTWM
ncbi:tetraspanin-10 isoform X2 [Oryzias latipes]|uniref:tetraspanin-10 isoform X2 n=1 Tax=Oryzias latipes TaxID=8090 RepID=UPI0005CB81A3|nr:tetraspanin-10 isoform X2 [Oryzias latipes]